MAGDNTIAVDADVLMQVLHWQDKINILLKRLKDRGIIEEQDMMVADLTAKLNKTQRLIEIRHFLKRDTDGLEVEKAALEVEVERVEETVA